MIRRLGRAVAGCLGCLVLFAPARSFAGERVVFCEAKSEACAGAPPLGDARPRGWWAAMDDGRILQAARTGKPVPEVLYESRVAYQHAVAGLSGQDLRAAILRRRVAARVGAVAAAPGCLFVAVQEDMLNVIRTAGRDGEAVVDGTLAAAMALAGDADRFKTLSAGETIAQARESLARLQVELKEGPAAAGYARERLTALIARVRPGEARAAPFESPERAYFAPDERPPARIDGELFVDRPWYAWRGGTVLVLRPSEAAEAPWNKKKLQLMYVDRATFSRDLSSLTDAQMNRRLWARLKGPPPDEDTALIARLAFAHAVFMRQATVVQATEPGLRAAWSETVRLSTDNLRLAIRPPTTEPVPRLDAALAQLRDDTALLAVLAHASAAPGAPLVDRFQEAASRLPR